MNILDALLKNNLTWQFFRPIAKVGRTLSQRRNAVLGITVQSDPLHYAYLFKSLVTLHGPFKGMKYPSLDAVGSTIYPKLLGSYERELHALIERITKTDYTEILDIGCAEGYYAVGLALRCNARVFAYDVSESARKLCSEMAALNGVEITVKSFCSPKELEDFPFTKKGLIVSDCEGYEFELFNKKNLSNLMKCDLLIETHDFSNIEISTKLINLFSETHVVTVIKSIDDIEKAKTYKYPETDALDLISKKDVFGEYRPRIMEWLFCTPKQAG